MGVIIHLLQGEFYFWHIFSISVPGSQDPTSLWVCLSLGGTLGLCIQGPVQTSTVGGCYRSTLVEAPLLQLCLNDDWFWKIVIPSGKCSSKLEQSQTCAGACGFPRGGENHSWAKTWSKTTCSVAHLWKVIRNITDLPLSSLPLLYPDRAFPSLL